MKLTKKEVAELSDLHSMVAHTECFGSRDVLRENALFQKATDEQLLEICAIHYQEEI